MKIIMIDDEKLAMSELSEILLEHYPDAEINQERPVEYSTGRLFSLSW